MRDRLLVVAAAAVATVAMISGCSGPGGGSTGDAPAAAATSSAPALPPRPSVVDLTGVDPCSVLTPAQQQQMGTDLPPKIVSAGGDRYGNHYCAYSKAQFSPRFSYQVKMVTQEDVSVFLTGKRLVTAEVVSAAGFPAIEYRLEGDEQACFVGVSTKQGQYLNVQYSEWSGVDEPTEVACEKARVAAEMAVQTLLAQR